MILYAHGSCHDISIYYDLTKAPEATNKTRKSRYQDRPGQVGEYKIKKKTHFTSCGEWLEGSICAPSVAV